MASEEPTINPTTEGAPPNSPSPAAGAGGVDGIAAAIALEQADRDPELAADLRNYLQDHRGYLQDHRSYLHDQRNLAGVQQRYLVAQVEHLNVQMERLHEQRDLTLTHMRHQHFSDWLSSAWKVLLVILGTGVVLAAGWLVWDARQDKGLVMEAFHVPDDLAAKGYTGIVVAARVLDHLKKLQAESSGARASSSYSLNWGESLQVEIPETGVSLGELKNFLHENLGNQTRISGEVVHTDQGIAIHVRAGEESGERIDGAESELDTLAERAAEKIYASTQPYRYASVLTARGRPDEGAAVLRALAANTRFPATERAWAYQGLSQYSNRAGDIEGARQAGLAAVRMDPELFDGYTSVGVTENLAGHDEAALKYFNQSYALWRTQRGRADVDPSAVIGFDTALTCMGAIFGDGESALEGCSSQSLLKVVAQAQEVVASTLSVAAYFVGTLSPALLRLHDIGGALAIVEATARLNPLATPLGNAVRAQAIEDWPAAAQAWPEILTNPVFRSYQLVHTQPFAYATARLGNLDAAQQLIDATPTDCYGCLRTRGKIAELKKDWSTAERWFSDAAKQGPSLPFANTEWGQMLLARGDTDRAVAQFQEAIKRQSHFADPYQYWGEALLAKGDARGAISKFEQAVKYAPKWGRIQIQWGAALKKLGRDAEARQKFAAAESVELVPSERALLAAART